ncbi:hypothetical protein AYI69_g10861 [Smittium culicis]|uniref:Uncharacterized protein n=1 Tax=Smittium culicis TaxID=133412 RepID=A0A1R1X2X4_9FUNG|nr:hypothetical protein AYI69_g10861 [Smittium culicis]
MIRNTRDPNFSIPRRPINSRVIEGGFQTEYATADSCDPESDILGTQAEMQEWLILSAREARAGNIHGFCDSAWALGLRNVVARSVLF